MKKLMNINYDISEIAEFIMDFLIFLMGLLSILLNKETVKMHKGLKAWVLLCFLKTWHEFCINICEQGCKHLQIRGDKNGTRFKTSSIYYRSSKWNWLCNWS